jgi:hypothetical protein
MLLENSRAGEMSGTPGSSAILLQLEKILRSPAFRTSKRSQEILNHLVRHALDGDTEGLKERIIGQEVFGRPADYDTGQDSIVRAKLNEVRKRLAQYFDDAGTAATVRIDIPVGTYVPEFHWINQPSAVVPAPPGRRIALMVGVGIVLVLAALALYPALSHRETPGFEAFWQPFFDNPKAVTLCVAHPKVYDIFGEQADELVLAYKPGTVLPPDAKPTLERRFSAAIIPEPYNFVGIGDAHAMAHLYAFFEGRNRATQIRRGNEMAFAELRSTPSVLIGGSQWSVSLTRELRYVVHPALAILDQKAGKPLVNIGPFPKGVPDSYVDYAIISRLIRSRTGDALLGVVGLSHYGTMAAGELVTDKAALESVLRDVKDWSPNKNCQIIIRVNVIIRAPEKPEVFASHVW